MNERMMRVGAAAAIGLAPIGVGIPAHAVVLPLSSDTYSAHIIKNDHLAPSPEQIRAARENNVDRQADVLKLLGGAGLGIWAIGGVLTYREKKKDTLESTIPLSEQSVKPACIVGTISSHPITRKDERWYRKYGDKSTPPLHEFTTTNPELFVSVAKAAGAQYRDTLADCKENEGFGRNVLVITARKKRNGEVVFRTCTGVRSMASDQRDDTSARERPER